MTDVIFGGSTPKGNVVWVPTALPALATTLLDPSKETLIKPRSSLQGDLSLTHETAARHDFASLPL